MIRFEPIPEKTDPKASATPEAITATMLALVNARGPGKTISPEDVARALGGDHPDGWSPLMIPVRKVAVKLAQAGKLAIFRKGKPVAPDDFKGVYRLGLPRPENEGASDAPTEASASGDLG